MVVLLFLVQKQNRVSPCLKLFGTKFTHSHVPGLKGEPLFLDFVFFALSADLRLVQIRIHKFILYEFLHINLYLLVGQGLSTGSIANTLQILIKPHSRGPSRPFLRPPSCSMPPN
jgi:hypothetical protein